MKSTTRTSKSVAVVLLTAFFTSTTLTSGFCQAVFAEDLSPRAVALNIPVSQSNQTSLKAEVPVVPDGVVSSAGSGPGIDIVDDSLNFHRAMGYSAPQGANTLQGNVSQSQSHSNSTGNSYYNNQAAMPQQSYARAYGGNASTMPQAASNFMNNPDMMKRAAGVVGAAALFGVFVKNGGLSGVTRSVGWDNHRHVRGASIGGY
ncbi:hypothetical protein GC174_07435 [bacterium]|nr:hypothetical protein [bacterium]